MSIRSIGLAPGLACALLAASGCKRDSAADAAPKATQPSLQAQTVAQLHWLGMDGVARETNATNFMSIWHEPESRKLLSQTLDKLAGWMTEGSRPAATNSSPAQKTSLQSTVRNSPLRPLLDDLVQDECYVEVRQVPNGPGNLAFAIRLNPEHAALWETNLALAVETAIGTRPASAQGTYGWQADLHRTDSGGQGSPGPARFLSLSRSGDWTILGLSQGSQPAPVPEGFPPPPSATNFWIAANFDLARISQALGLDWKLPANTPRVSLNAIGDGENVISHGDLTFAQPLPMTLGSWKLPTNLIHGPLVSLVAARGLAPWLGQLTLFSNFPPANLPDQFYMWGRYGLPSQLYYALPIADATDALNMLAGPITNSANPKIQPNNGSIALDTTQEVLSWTGLPHAQPFLKAVTDSNPQLLYGGFAPELHPQPMPPELRDHILEATNLAYFNWEVTGEMLLYWRYLDDVYRIAFDNSGPRLSGTASLKWLAANTTNFSHTVTEARLEAPTLVSFVRKSTIGVNSLELEALANWLELPQFPLGLSQIIYTNPAPSYTQLIKLKHQRHKLPPQTPAQH